MLKNSTTDEIVSAFFSASRVLKQKLDSSSPLFELPTSQLETLRLISEHKQIPMKEVAEFLSITPPSATVLVNNLVKLGLVQRRADPEDRRTVHLKLTAKGSKAMQKAINKRCEIFKKLLTKLSQNEQASFLEILRKMTN